MDGSKHCRPWPSSLRNFAGRQRRAGNSSRSLWGNNNIVKTRGRQALGRLSPLLRARVSCHSRGHSRALFLLLLVIIMRARQCIRKPPWDPSPVTIRCSLCDLHALSLPLWSVKRFDIPKVGEKRASLRFHHPREDSSLSLTFCPFEKGTSQWSAGAQDQPERAQRRDCNALVWAAASKSGRNFDGRTLAKSTDDLARDLTNARELHANQKAYCTYIISFPRLLLM